MTDDQHAHDTDPDRELTDPTFEELFNALREVGSRPAPPVGAELATLITTGVGSGPRRRKARTATVGLVVMGVVAGGVGAAAAAGHLPVPTGADTHLVDRRTPRDATDETSTPPSPATVPSPHTVTTDPGQGPSPDPEPGQEDSTDSPDAPAPHRTSPSSQGPATNGDDDDDADETGDDQSGEDQSGEDENEGHGSDDSSEGQGHGSDDSNEGGGDDATGDRDD